jgi:hypothetical protein
VVSTAKTDIFTTTSTSFTDVTGLSVSITPASSSNKILIIQNTQVGSISGTFGIFVQLVRDSTAIFISDAAGSRSRSLGMYSPASDSVMAAQCTFLDSPATTSAITYKIQVKSNTGATAKVNTSSADTDASTWSRAVSSITVMEVAG